MERSGTVRELTLCFACALAVQLAGCSRRDDEVVEQQPEVVAVPEPVVSEDDRAQQRDVAERIAALKDELVTARSSREVFADDAWTSLLDRSEEVATLWCALPAALRVAIDAARLADSLNLLSQRSLTRQQRGKPIAPTATRLHALYRALDDASVEASLTTLRCRTQLALAAGHPEVAQQVLARPRPTAARPGDAVNAILLDVLAGRLECELGRLERAGEHVHAALAMAQEALRAAGSEAEQLPALQVLRNAVYAAADLHLLDGDCARGLEVLELLPADDATAGWYRLILGTVARDPKAERQLQQLLERQQVHPRLRTMAAAKLAQAAMERGDFALAVARREQLGPHAGDAPEDPEHRFALIDLELLLHGFGSDPDRIREHAERGFAELLARWRASPRPPGGIGFLQQEDRSTWLSTMVRSAFAQSSDAQAADPEGGERAIERVLQAHAAAIATDDTCTPAELRAALLPDGAALLIYLPGRVHSAVLVVDGDSATAIELPSAMQLRGRIDRLSAALADRLAGLPGDRWRAAAAAAADDLLPDALRERFAGGSQLTICGAGMLQNAPYDLLPTGDGEHDLLGLQVPLCYAANLLEHVSRPPAAPANRVLLAAALGTTRDGATRQTVGAAAVAPLLAPYAVDHRSLLLDDEVTTARLQQRLTEGAVVHVIAHGVDDAHRAHPNGVAFADDLSTHGLFYDQVEHLDLLGRTCIVGACNAGDAPWRRGDEPLETTLAGGMLRAGARCVLVPTTVITFQAHVDAMAVVHERLAAGDVPAVALLAARRRLQQPARERALLELLLTQVHGNGF